MLSTYPTHHTMYYFVSNCLSDVVKSLQKDVANLIDARYSHDSKACIGCCSYTDLVQDEGKSHKAKA